MRLEFFIEHMFQDEHETRRQDFNFLAITSRFYWTPCRTVELTCKKFDFTFQIN